MQGPPYFDWRLDRWKIGLALLLWIGLLVFSPAQPPLSDPQGASSLARPGQRPVVGASSQMDTAPAVAQTMAKAEAEETVQPLAQSSPLPAAQNLAQTQPVPIPQATPPAPTVEPSIFASNPPQLMILEPSQGPLTNSTPLLFGRTSTDGLVEILVEGRRYATAADGDGYWQFAPSAPLPVGMTWVQARVVDASGVALSETSSQIALVGASAQPVSPPVILTPLPSAGKMENSTPYFSGSGPAGRRLLFFAQVQAGLRAAVVPGESGQPVGALVGEVVVSAEGVWGWQMAAPLPAGRTTVWAVAVNESDVPLSRSWPVTLDVADHAVPSADVRATR